LKLRLKKAENTFKSARILAGVAPNMPAGDPSPSSYTFGPFRFEGTLRRLYKHDERIALTPKAADTLLALLERANRIVEKDELLRVVWGDVFVGEDTRAQNISTLRRVLGDDASQPQFIVTMPRRGYQFVAPVTTVPNEADGSVPETQVSLERLSRGTSVRATAVAFVLVLLGLALPRVWKTEDVRRPAAEFSVAEPDGHRFSASGGMLAVSPDGEQLAFVAADARGIAALWLRPLGSAAYRRLDGTDGAAQPFWSPDSRFVGFFSNKRLKAVDVVSGAVRVIASLTNARALGATWSRRQQILFSVPDDGLYTVPASGGLATRLTPAVDAACNGCSAWPSFLPDGRHFLFTLTTAKGIAPGIYVGELGTANGKHLIDAASSSAYVDPGFLLFARDGTLYVQPFDAAHRQITGAPRPIVDGVAFNPRTGRVLASMSETGVVVFRRPLITTLEWVDRAGTPQTMAASPAIYTEFSIAPDGKRVAAARIDPHTGTSDVWVFGEGIETRVTNDPDWDGNPVWTADGSRVVYSSRRGDRWGLYSRSPSPLGPEEVLLDTDTPVTPLQALQSSDVIFAARQSFDLWQLAAGKSTPLAQLGGFYPSDARLSPDAKWLAYGRPETAYGVSRQTVYLRSASLTTDRRVIADGGSSPRWRADGQELFYLAQDSSVVAVPLDSRSAPDDTRRHVLFQTTGPAMTGLSGQLYDAASDGRNFLVKREVASSPIYVRVNWTAP
jgi:DNA-binding winged helix-turn-helix (wHTH) protein/Tol biopolymer transport system component